MRSVVAITGANGFIGTKLVAAFVENGYAVKALVHHMPAEPYPHVTYIQYDLAKPPDKAFFQDVKLVIHAAFSLEEKILNGRDVNITAIEALMHLQLPQYVFISSFAAANPVTPSYYGTCKKKAESYFSNHLIIRPGLVVGNGGLYKRIATQINKIPIFPLIDSGKQRIQVIYIDDLVNSMLLLVAQSVTGIIHLAHPEPISYKALVVLIAKKLGKRIYFIRVKLLFMKCVLRLLKVLSLTRLSSDNLAGLMADKHIDTTAELTSLQGNWLKAQDAINAIKTDVLL